MELLTILEKLDAIEASASSIVVGNVDPESVHANNVDKREFLSGSVTLRQRTPKVAKGLLPSLGVSVSQVQDATKWKCCEVECLGTTALEVGVVHLQTSGLEAKAKLGLPETICPVGQKPGRAGALG